MLATASTDEYIKIWDIGLEKPKMITNKKMNMGKLYSLQFYQDIPWVLAAGGSRGEVAIWDVEENNEVKI